MLESDFRPKSPKITAPSVSTTDLHPELCNLIVTRMRGEGEVSLGNETGVKDLFLAIAKRLSSKPTFSPAEIMRTVKEHLFDVEKMDGFVGISSSKRETLRAFLLRNDGRYPTSPEAFPNESRDSFNRAASISCDEFNNYRSLYFAVAPALRTILPTEVFGEMIRSEYPAVSTGRVESELLEVKNLSRRLFSILSDYGISFGIRNPRDGNRREALILEDGPILRMELVEGYPVFKAYTSIGSFNLTGFFGSGRKLDTTEKLLQFTRDLCEALQLGLYQQTGREKMLSMLDCSRSGILLAPLQKLPAINSGASIFIPFIFSDISNETGRSRFQERYFPYANSSLQFCHLIDQEEVNRQSRRASRIKESTPQDSIEKVAVELYGKHRENPRELIDLLFSEDIATKEGAAAALIACEERGILAIIDYDNQRFIDEDYATAMQNLGAEPPPDDAIVAPGVSQLVERKEIRNVLKFVSEKAIASATTRLFQVTDLRELKTAATIEVLKLCGERAINAIEAELKLSDSPQGLALAVMVMEAIDSDTSGRFDLYLNALKSINNWAPEDEDLISLRKDAIEDLLMLTSRGVNPLSKEQMDSLAEVVTSNSEEYKKVYEIGWLLSRLITRSGRSGLEATKVLCAAGFNFDSYREKIEFDIASLPFLGTNLNEAET